MNLLLQKGAPPASRRHLIGRSPGGVELVLAFGLAALGFPTLIVAAGTSGALDLGFDPGTALGTNYGQIVHAVLADCGGGVVVGGEFTIANGASGNNILRLNTNGTVDATFQATVTLQGGGARVDTLALEGNQILIGGNFDSVNGYARQGLARLNADGTLDTNFNPNLGYFPEVQLILLQPDGRIIAGGFAVEASVGSTYRYDLVRLLPDGSVDLTFDIGFGGVGGFIYTGALQPDGNLVIGGFFNAPGSPTNIARLNSSGVLDTNYWPALDPLGIVYGLAVQADGKAVIAGEFNSVNGITRYGYARINTDGTLDTTFQLRDAGTNAFSAGGRLQSVVIQSDQKILLGGTYLPSSGGIDETLARFLADGTPDPNFISLVTDGSSVAAVGLQSDGKILVGGQFPDFGGVQRDSVARLLGDAAISPGPMLALQRSKDGAARLTFGTQPGRKYSIDCSADLGSWSEITNFYASSWLTQTTDPAARNLGRRFYRARLWP